MRVQQCIEVNDSSQIGEARRASLRTADTLKLKESRRSDVAIIATELATNLVRHAKGGRLLIQVLDLPPGPCLELLAIDSGPGMSDLQKCLQDGYSTGGTAGTGLGAARRLSDEFDAYTTVGSGTVVFSRVRADDWNAGAHQRFDIGAVSIPAPHEVVCGDAWRHAENDGQMSLMVADGLGHGPLACEAAQRAVDTFDAEPFADFDRFFDRAHVALAGGRGAAISCARLSPAREVRFAGVGNVSGSLLGGERGRGLPSQNGTVGVQMRKGLQVSAYEWPANGLLVMHSDGLTSRWTLEPYPGLLVRHPATVAGVLYKDFLRGRDDATVVVVGQRRAR